MMMLGDVVGNRLHLPAFITSVDPCSLYLAYTFGAAAIVASNFAVSAFFAAAALSKS
jgi:hypothetical protein